MSSGNGEEVAPASHGSLPSAQEPIAVVGIGCRFPGRANDPESFWRLLEEGVDAITEIPSDRWSVAAFHDPDPGKPGKTYSRWGGFIDGIDHFDPAFFGISPREAARMDPQQRMLLEVAWECLEDAGLPLERIAGSRMSVFVGISSFDYSVLETSFRDRAGQDAYSNTGGSLSIAANRISYCFDLRGQSAAVDTACSSALVAVHMACQSIWHDGCPMALAGGVNALLLPDWYVGFCRMGMLSPEGRCKAFDAGASGFVRSEGAGMVVLKPLSRALDEGDRVYALIRATATNQDGRTPGITVPSQQAQEALVREACRVAQVNPAAIHFVEAHGTGTLVGDPIEARALGRVLSIGRAPKDPCVIGSVKTNIGHLEAGAGIAGLIKVALALHHRCIPGNLHFHRPNPEIDWDALRLRVPTQSEPWPDSNGPALAGVNAFGFGGTNAHALLQEAPRAISRVGQHRNNGKAAESAGMDAARACLVPMSARSEPALRALARVWQEYLANCPPDVSLDEIASSAAMRRTHHDHRLAVVARSRQEAAEQLNEYAQGGAQSAVAHGRAPSDRRPRIAFVCSGQGPQWWGMGRELLQAEPIFRASIERCDIIVRQLGDWSLLDELTAPEARSRMDNTAISQPCIFALQIGLAELWASWGVRPSALLGHSVGEVAAAFLAGVYSLEDAVRIIYHRGRTMHLAGPHGRMLAAGLPESEALALLAANGEEVSLAAVNSPNSVTLSGESAAIEALAGLLEARGVFCRLLKVTYGFHSAQMDPIRDELLAALGGIGPRAAAVPLFSSVTGRAVDGRELGPEYWWHNVRRTVRFADGVERVIEHGCDNVIELGAHPVLAAAVAECYATRGKNVTLLPSLRRQEVERQRMLQSLAGLYALGQPIEWGALQSQPRRFVRLPLYPWQRERYWHEADESRVSRLKPPAHPLLGVAQGEPRPAWEARLDLRVTPYLADHRVQHAAIMPAAAYLEIALAACRESFGAIACELREVNFANPCFLADERPLRLLTTIDRSLGTLEIHTRPVEGDHEWTLHLTANAHARPPGTLDIASSIDPIRNRCSREYSHEACYDYLREAGLDYGPAFKGIERVWQGDSESLGLVALPVDLKRDRDSYVFHPAFFDACLQVVVASDRDFTGKQSGLYLPHDVASLRLCQRPGGRVWVHARLLEKTPHRCVTDLDVYGEDGTLAASVRGLSAHRVAGREESLDDLLYAYQWRDEPAREPDHSRVPGRWLIFADNTGTAAHLAQELRDRGDECTLVRAGSAFEQRDEEFQVDPEREDDMHRVIEAFCKPDRNVRLGIVHLWNLGAPSSDTLTAPALMAAVPTGLLSIVHLVQAWDRAAVDVSAPLFLVTRGAQSVRDEPEPLAVAQAPAIGLGRVIMGEYARLRTRLVDLDPGAADHGVSALLREIDCRDDEDEIAVRGPAHYVARFAPAPGVPAEIAARPAESGESFQLAVRRPGTLDGLVLERSHRRRPGPGEVEIEVEAAGVNFSDVMKALGIYPGLSDGPIPLGAECSGRITATGAEVSGLHEGDAVVAIARYAFGSHVVTNQELVAVLPSAVNVLEAATLPIAFLTAAYAMEYLGRLATGERVLIHSASGGVGQAAVQLARRAGATILATAGTPEKRDYLRRVGIECVGDSRSLDFAEMVMEQTSGRGVDMILNSLPGEAIPRGLAVLADHGRFLEIGKRDIHQNARLGLRPFQKNLSFFAVDLDRVIRERPALLGSILRDIVRRVGEGELAPLPLQSVRIGEWKEALRLMQQGRHIGKIVLSRTQEAVATVAPLEQPLSLRSDGTYLIAGGLGGFGLALAGWMVERGAGAIVLLGRHGAATSEAQHAVANLKTRGTRIVVHAADIAQEAELAAVLEAIDRDLPSLRGVVHAAMVLDDALVINLDRQKLDAVLAPKLRGTWNLHAQTAKQNLDFFIMCSSIASVLGHAGQANYAAANAFLDAMASFRRSRGLPALAVNWGHLGDAGYLARHPALAERLDRQGLLRLSVQEALASLEKVIARQSIQVSVLRADWSRLRQTSATGRESPRYAQLRGRLDAGPPRPSNGAACTRDSILAASPASRAPLIGAHLCEKVARVLGTSADRLDRDRPLLQLGVDSLMAVELRNWIEGELGVNLPIVELIRSPGVEALSALLAQSLERTQQSAADEVPRSEAPQEARSSWHANGRNGHAAPLPFFGAPASLRARVDELAPDQVDALLAELLNERASVDGT
jgi:acyl transferase domain-containing protein/aryl carrier-like protein